MNTINVNPQRFLLHWLASAIGVWPVAAVACLVAWTPIAILTAILGQYESLFPLARIISTIAIFIIPGMSIGYVIGDLQHTLLRDILKWDFQDWVRYSSIGGVAGGLLVILAIMTVGRGLSENLQWMITMPLFILPISIMQWRLLRQSARDAWLWIAANLTAAIVFSGLVFNTRPLSFLQYEPLNSIIIWFFAAMSIGVITGVVMLWLYEHPLSDWNDDDAEFAPVYIEVRNRDDR